MSFEDISPYEQQKIKKRLEDADKKTDGKEESPLSDNKDRISSFIMGLSGGSKIRTHAGKWEVTSVGTNERGEKIINRKKEGIRQSITADALKREILESKKRMTEQKKEKRKEPEKPHISQKEEKVLGEKLPEEKLDKPEESFDYMPEENKDFRAGRELRDAGIMDEKLGIDTRIMSGERRKEKPEKKPGKQQEIDLFKRTREMLRNSNLELSQETAGKWQEYTKERYEVLLNNLAREFCEKNGIVADENASPDFYRKKLDEEGGIDKLSIEVKERLDKMERLLDIAEKHGTSMSIDERYLLMHFGLERTDKLFSTIRNNEEEEKDSSREKAEMKKILDLLEKTITETEGLVDEEGNSTFKKKLYTELYNELEIEYNKEGRLDEFEELLDRTGEGGEKKIETDKLDEFHERSDEKYYLKLQEEIRKRVGSYESARGGIEEWYGKVKEDLVNDLLGKKDGGELDLGIDKEPKTEAEAREMLSETLSRVTGEKVSSSDIEKVKKKMGEKGIGKKFFEGARKRAGGICGLIAIFLLGLIFIEFGISFLLLKKLGGKKAEKKS